MNALIMKDLFKLPESGVYALIEPTLNRAHIVSTTDILGSLGRLVDLMKNDKRYSQLRGNYDTVVFVLLESTVCRNNYRIKQTYWEDKYKRMGYTLYVETQGVRYKAVVETVNVNFKLRPCVQLVSKNRKRVTVGVFESLNDAETFHSLYYKDGVYDIVYAQNDLTKSYCKNKID